MSDFDDFFDNGDDIDIPAGPTCPVHHIELPVSGVCDECVEAD